MKTTYWMLNVLLLAGGMAAVNAQAPADVSLEEVLALGILPDSIPVLENASADPNERPISGSEKNPFSEREREASRTEVQAENEELKIKRLIDKMQVHGGLMKRADGPKVLLGDLILKRGALVPQILPDQTEQLVVRELDEQKIELAFLDTPEYTGQPRVIIIPMDMRPTVGQVLAGGNDDYIVERGRDEMAAEQQLSAVLETRASGGSIATTIPGIKVNGRTARRDAGGGLSSLLRNYGQPPAAGDTEVGESSAQPGPPARGSLPSRQQDEIPFDFGGFEMEPAGADGADGAGAMRSPGAAPDTGAVPSRPTPGRNARPGDEAPAALPAFTN